MTRDLVKRDRDGSVLDVVKEEAEQADTVANAKRVIFVDTDGNVVDANYVLFDADDSQPDYIGLNDDADANTSDTDWLIYKFTYSGSNVTQIKKKKGAWDNRASLF